MRVVYAVETIPIEELSPADRCLLYLTWFGVAYGATMLLGTITAMIGT